MFLDQVMFQKTKVPVLTAVLDVTQLRQRVIANNIANVGTVGYRRKAVRFQEYLDSFVHRPAVEGLRTDERHIPIPRRVSGPEVYRPESSVNDTGINNVDVDREMADLAETGMTHELAATLLRGRFDRLRRAIRGTPGPSDTPVLERGAVAEEHRGGSRELGGEISAGL
jgi:flagellar basal-body rod protein FlgB